jgi:EmrB/QacA subfamily drug resistance transporter
MKFGKSFNSLSSRCQAVSGKKSRIDRQNMTENTTATPLAIDRGETTSAQRGIIIGLMAPSAILGIYISMFSVAIPAIRTDFQVSADTAAWVATIYNLPFMMFMPLYGRLGDALGKRRLFMVGLGLFMAGTAMAGAAPNLAWLMAGRAIQGLGTAGFVPLAIAIITQRFPAAERGKVMGTWNSIIPLTGIVGPFLGGLLIDHIGWRAIFGPVVVLGLGALLMVRQKIPGRASLGQLDFLRRFDWGGVLLLALLSTSLLFYAASRPITGVASLADWRLLGLTLLLLALFLTWESRRPDPFVPLNLFRIGTFTLASLCAGIRMFTLGGVHFLVPLYLADVHQLSAASTGIVLTAHAIPLFLMLRLGGQVGDRWGSRWPVVISLLSQTLAMVFLALLPGQAAVWLVVLGVMAQSLGAGLSLAPLHAVSMADISAEQTGVAAGLYSMMRFAGTVFGTALSGVVLQQGLDRALPPLEAYQISFWFVAGVTVIGAVLGMRLKV